MGRRNKTKFAILGMLTLQPLTGSDIREFAEDVLGFFWQESYGAIYPTLRRLRDEGLVEREVEASAAGPDRQIHRVTEAGRQALRQWLEEPAELQVPRNEMLLKLFFGPEAPLTTMRAHVERYAIEQRAALKRLEEATARLDAEARAWPHYAFWKLGSDFGRRRLRASLDWAEEALATLADGAPVQPGKQADDGGGNRGAA